MRNTIALLSMMVAFILGCTDTYAQDKDGNQFSFMTLLEKQTSPDGIYYDIKTGPRLTEALAAAGFRLESSRKIDRGYMSVERNIYTNGDITILQELPYSEVSITFNDPSLIEGFVNSALNNGWEGWTQDSGIDGGSQYENYDNNFYFTVEDNNIVVGTLDMGGD